MLSTIFVSNFTPSSVIILADKNREKVLYKTTIKWIKNERQYAWYDKRK